MTGTRKLYERLVAAQAALSLRYAHEGIGAVRRLDAVGRRWREWAIRRGRCQAI